MSVVDALHDVHFALHESIMSHRVNVPSSLLKASLIIEWALQSSHSSFAILAELVKKNTSQGHFDLQMNSMVNRPSSEQKMHKEAGVYCVPS